ncbi:MAG: hypothetical protein A2X04_05495 [Bacteroidetes bacterium GWF2_41_9]|nr:MAG: hypothetical protein A2X04_05495 [Bacteroidetes bacterium GWF2_41_9]
MVLCQVNKSTTPAGGKHCKHQIINHPGHPSFKRRGNFLHIPFANNNLKLTAMRQGGKNPETN